MDETVWRWLGCFVLPTWLAAGLLDYACHRRLRSELSTGVPESLLHLAQVVQNGAAVGLLLFAAPGPTTFAWIAALVALHTLTAWLDLRYASVRREVPAPEQFAHAFLIVLPIAALPLVALLADGGRRGIHWQWPQLPRTAVVAALAASAACALLPGLLELRRALRASGPR